jgi:hypothetical protein
MMTEEEVLERANATNNNQPAKGNTFPVTPCTQVTSNLYYLSQLGEALDLSWLHMCSIALRDKRSKCIHGSHTFPVKVELILPCV